MVGLQKVKLTILQADGRSPPSEAISFWRGKHITFTQRERGCVYFYVPDDPKRCEGNIWKIVLAVEKID